ncbi:MAG TPA: glutathione peroxidase [Flavisolibacter sp.]|nr:glutathione peroxidase [Flavisolibacter sp.]
MALTLRQKALKLIYPLFLWMSKKNTKEQILVNEKQVAPPASFYSLAAVLTNGKELSFENMKGKKVLLVNTASDCGYTPQYTELQKLYQHSKEDLEIIAFPANDFKEQEKGSDTEIAAFCSRNYGVSFPIAKKAVVVKTPAQHPVFQWLSDKKLNGWNDKEPSWNFSKFLVNEEGVLTHYFEPAVSPMSDEVIRAVHA